MADFWDGWTGTIRIGDGPEIPVAGPIEFDTPPGVDTSRYVAPEEPGCIRAGGLRFEWTSPVRGDLDALLQAANDRADRKIEKWREGIDLRDMGVDPGRVIEGEIVRKEIEGG